MLAKTKVIADRFYLCRLKEPITINGTLRSPMHQYRLSGELVLEYYDSLKEITATQ